GAFAGIEIEHDLRWPVDVWNAVQKGMQLQSRQIRQPRERAHVVDDDVVDLGLAAPSRHGEGLHPGGRKARRILLVEELASNSVGITLERHGPVFKCGRMYGETRT